MIKARDLWERITEFPSKYRILRILALLLIALGFLGLRYFYPHADSQSARAVLGALIPTVATFFGFMLVAFVLIVQLSGRASKDLRALLPGYLELLRGPNQPETLAATSIDLLRCQYLRLLQRGDFGLLDMAEAAGGLLKSEYTHGELFEMISVLTYVVSEYFHYEDVQRIKDDMRSIGYSDHQIVDVIYVEGAIPLLQPRGFFETLGDALDVIHFPHWQGQPDLVLQVFQRAMRDDIDVLFDRMELFERASGNLFWITSSILLVVMAMASLLLLGLTPTTIDLGLVRGWLLATLLGAIISVYLVVLYLAQLL